MTKIIPEQKINRCIECNYHYNELNALRPTCTYESRDIPDDQQIPTWCQLKDSTPEPVKDLMGIKPRLLDLFCGVGGAAMGYYRAGFEVVGVDIVKQPHYPFEFHQADALTYPLEGFDAYHASPPCQAFSTIAKQNRTMRPGVYNHPNLIPQTRERLISTGKPYVIENVPGSPLINAITLCGTMFNLNIIRHRLFETNPQITFPPYSCNHYKKVVAGGRSPKPNEFHSVVGHHSGVELARQAMGIDWMIWGELVEAIPPTYTKYLGDQIYRGLQ